MKKLFFTLALALLFKGVSALPLWICTSQGYLFQVTWYYIAGTNQLGYYLENQGPGTCAGGPWQMSATLIDPNIPDGSQPPIASEGLHGQFSTYAEPIPVDYATVPVKEAVGVVMNNPTPTKSFDPNRIHATWAKSFALANSQDVYYMKLAANPTLSHNLNFQIWSTKSQAVTIKLISATTGLDAWSSTMELTEGKNIKNISVSGSINGTHVLQVTSSNNVLSANIVVN